MGGIRPLSLKDIPEVVNLFERILRSGAASAPDGLADAFAQMFLVSPVADPEIPPLVYEGPSGEVGGFIGSTVRRMMLDGQRLRLACPGPIFTTPEVRIKGAGALLMRTYLAGPQEISLSDRQNPVAHQLFTRLGGEVAHLQCLRWTKVFQPYVFKGSHLAISPQLKPLVKLAGQTLDRVSRGFKATPPRVGLSGEALTPAGMIEHADVVQRSFRLHPNYDGPYLEWLFGELAKIRYKGKLHAVMVRDRDRNILGWYLYYLQPDGLADMLQLAAPEAAVGVLLEHLFEHAQERGATALRARLEPRLREAVRRGGCRLHQAACLLIHSKNPEVLKVINSGHALVSQLEGQLLEGVFGGLFPYKRGEHIE